MSEKSVKVLQQLDQAYAYIATPVFIVSVKENRIALANKSALKMCGYKASEMEDVPLVNFFHEEDQKRLLLTIESGEDHGIYSEFNLRIVRKSGRLVIVNLSGRKVSLAHKSFLVLNIYDITELQKAHDELEQKVQTRTADLKASKNRLRAILNSSLQGFFTFNQDLQIEDNYSIRAEQFLGKDLTGKNVCDVLNLNHAAFSGFCKLVFQGKSWEIIEKAATMESRVNERNLKLEFAPVTEEKKVKGILCTITDITRLKRIEKRNENLHKEGRTIIKILQSKAVFLNLLRAVQEIKEDNEILVKRQIHTLKGEFSFFECQDLVEVCQLWEGKWKEKYDSGDLKAFLKQFRATLDKFLDKYGDVLRLTSSGQGRIEVTLESIRNLAHQVDSATLEQLVERPAEECFEWLNDAWLITAKNLKKKVRPILWRKSTPLFTEPYKKLFSTLVHAVRNSANHGIEDPEDRLASGKPETGNLTAELEVEKGFFRLRLRDDGRGVRIEEIKAKALKLGLPIPHNEEDITDLLFEDKLTTLETPSEFSGAGIGLGAIKTEAVALGGNAKLYPVMGGGLELHVWFRKVPITEALAR